MARPVVFGAAYSVYVRIVRLALAEKGVPYDLHAVDVFAPGGPPAEHFGRHPFGKIPAFRHDDFALYETGAIVRYVDEAFAGPPLVPTDLRRRARMNQAIGLLDAYAYPSLVWGVYAERISKPRRGRGAPDEAVVTAALQRSATCLEALQAIRGEAPWLAGEALSLADLYAAPMLDYFVQVPEGERLLAGRPGLDDWWRRLRGRASMAATPVT